MFEFRDGVYTPRHERIFKLENGYYLLYYYQPEYWRMFRLYLKFLIPMAGLIYLIKKNPFYQSYPAMLPGMFFMTIALIYQMVKYSKVTNNLVH